MEKSGLYYPGGPQAPNADQGQEYGCKFCTKTFPNRQALGGHQNAHKIQRTVEKRTRDMRDNNHFGYYGGGGGSVAYPGLYPGSYSRSNDFVDRSVYNNPIQHGMRVVGNPYGSAQPVPVPGFNDVYSGRAAPGPRNIVSQSPGHVVSHVQTRSMNSVFPNNGMGGSGSGSGSSSRPVYMDLSGLAAPRIRPGGNPGRGNRDRANNPGIDQQCEDDESGLDLSLKL